MRLNFQSILPHLVAAGIFLITAVAYFSPQFSGKVIPQSDIIGYKGMSQELKAYKAATGEESLWTNSMFGGMPSYQINTVSSGNFIKKGSQLTRLFVKAPAGQFIAAMICFYLLMVLLGVNSWLSVIGAIAFGFATNNLVLYEAGHVTKLNAIAYLPLVASGMLLAFRKKYLLGGILFGIGLSLDLASNHVQMTYYFFITVIIWGIAELILNIKQQTLPHFGKAAAALIVGGLLALGSVASNLWITYEYAQDTMRGKPILEQAQAQGAAQSSSEVDGLEWGYAMNWSNNTLDLFSSYIPGVVGGGSAQSISKDTPYGKKLTSLGYRIPAEFDAPVYWGGLPSTSGPIYFGAVMVLFFIIGLFIVEGPIKWWLALGTLLTLLMSMGSNFESLNRFFFDYFPLYNKFRTPNSVLSVTSFLVPALAILALNEIIQKKTADGRLMKGLAIGGGISIALALFFALLGPSMFDFSSAFDTGRLTRMLGGDQAPEVIASIISSLQETRADLMQSDAWRSFLLVALSVGGVYLYLQDKIKTSLLLGGLAVLTVFDLFGVGMRYLNNDDFQRQSAYNQIFQPRAVDTQILADPDPHYRVFDVTVASFESAQPSYHHKMVGGYHAAKLQRFQDLIDRHFSQGNQAVFDMLNTKYFILPGQQGQPAVQQNPGALGNAWLVDSVVIVPNANAEIDALNGLPLDHAVAVHQEYSDYVKGLNLSGSGSVKLTEYRPNKLTYQSTASQEELAVFSEIWYGPNKGWQAYIDGEAVDHIRVNYVLRAMKIPAGSHEIVFEFSPKKFQMGKVVSSISSLLLLLALLGYIYQNLTAKTVAEPKPKTKKGKK